MYWHLSPITELDGQIGPVWVFEPPVANVSVYTIMAIQRCSAAHDFVVSSGDTDGIGRGSKASLELRFFAVVAESMVGWERLSNRLIKVGFMK